MSGMPVTMLDGLFGLDGKLALVTGGGLVPQAVAKALEGAGACVVRVADPQVSSEDQARSVIGQAPELDILVNGHIRVGAYPLDVLTMDTWDDVHACNARSVFLLMREAVRSMRARGEGGRIINLSTIGSLHPVLHGNYAYGSSRAAMNALTRSFALDFAKDGIRSNSILVGSIQSDPWPEAAPPPGGPGTTPGRVPLGPGRPEDIAGLALLLAGEGGRYINGQMIAVDGGFSVA